MSDETPRKPGTAAPGDRDDGHDAPIPPPSPPSDAPAGNGPAPGSPADEADAGGSARRRTADDAGKDEPADEPADDTDTGGSARDAGPAPEDGKPEQPERPEQAERPSADPETALAPVEGEVDQPTPDPAHDLEQRRREAGVDQLFPFGRPGQPVGRAHPFVFGFTAALGVITAWLLVNAARDAKSVIIMIVVAMFLAVGLNPAVERLKKLGLSRRWAVVTVFFLVILFFAGIVASLVPPLTEQVSGLTKNVPNYIAQLQSNPKIADWDRRYHLLEQAQNKVKDPKFQQDLAKRAYDVGRQAVTGTFQTLTILILTLYFLSSLPQIKTFFYKLAPRTRRARVALLGDEILDRIGGYVAGQFTIAFVAGIFSYILLKVLDVKYALALALIVAVTDLIPLVGATIGAVVVCLVAFLTGTTEGIVCVIFYVCYQQFENYFLYPRVMKRTVNVQPAVTVIAALIGATLFGVVGALLAIPTAAAISLIIREVLVPRQERL